MTKQRKCGRSLKTYARDNFPPELQTHANKSFTCVYPYFPVSYFRKLKFDENNQQREQDERFDKSQTDNHQCLNRSRRARIASRAFRRF